MTVVDYQVTVDGNDLPEELFVDDEPSEMDIAQSLSSSNTPVCTGCAATTCRQLLVAGTNVSVAQATVAITTAYVAANAPDATASDVNVNVTGIESTVDRSGWVVSLGCSNSRFV